jgi:hypothetical protein
VVPVFYVVMKQLTGSASGELAAAPGATDP